MFDQVADRCDLTNVLLSLGATRLPFADRTFDALTISFGLRNMHDYPRGLAEMLRVTKPGGRLVVGEFSRPTPPPSARSTGST